MIYDPEAADRAYDLVDEARRRLDALAAEWRRYVRRRLRRLPRRRKRRVVEKIKQIVRAPWQAPATRRTETLFGDLSLAAPARRRRKTS